MAKLEEKGDKTFKWVEFEEGEELYLGTHHGDAFGMNGDDVHAFYIGVLEDRHRFVNPVGGEFLTYSCEMEAPAIFYGEGGDDSVDSPAVKTTYDGVVPDGDPRDFVVGAMGRIVSGLLEGLIAKHTELSGKHEEMPMMHYMPGAFQEVDRRITEVGELLGIMSERPGAYTPNNSEFRMIRDNLQRAEIGISLAENHPFSVEED